MTHEKDREISERWKIVDYLLLGAGVMLLSFLLFSGFLLAMAFWAWMGVMPTP